MTLPVLTQNVLRSTAKYFFRSRFFRLLRQIETTAPRGGRESDRSGILYRLHNRIKVQLITEFHELFPKAGYM
jgi:hypothetical protein